MRMNFGRNKRKIEETRKARQEEKRKKKLEKRSGPGPETPPADNVENTGL